MEVGVLQGACPCLPENRSLQTCDSLEVIISTTIVNNVAEKPALEGRHATS